MLSKYIFVNMYFVSVNYFCVINDCLIFFPDIPSAKILVDSKVFFGSELKIWPCISSTPRPNKAEWQKSVDGDVFHCIDIDKQEYNGSAKDPKFPSLVIQNTTFENMLYYRLRVWNGIGECVSNTVFLDVTGSMFLRLFLII